MAKETLNQAHELALAVLKAAAKEGTLSDAHRAELMELLGAHVRPKVTEVLETPVAAEAEKRELTPEQVDGLVSTLKSRFERPENKKPLEALSWEDVEKSLRANAEEILHLEESGGEPQVVGMEGDEYIIEDRSAESPAGRRNRSFKEADAQRTSFGPNVKFQSRDSYLAMQRAGKFDSNSWSWLEADSEYRKNTGSAMDGDRRGGVRPVDGYDTDGNEYGGWRASLRFKKV